MPNPLEVGGLSNRKSIMCRVRISTVQPLSADRSLLIPAEPLHSTRPLLYHLHSPFHICNSWAHCTHLREHHVDHGHGYRQEFTESQYYWAIWCEFFSQTSLYQCIIATSAWPWGNGNDSSQGSTAFLRLLNMTPKKTLSRWAVTS